MSTNDDLDSSAGGQPHDESLNADHDGGEYPQKDGNTEATDFSNPETMAAAFDQLDPEQLENLLAGNQDEGSDDTTEIESQDDPERGEDPAKEENETDNGKESDETTAPDRIRLKGLPERDKLRMATAIQAVRDGTYKGFDEAYADLYGPAKVENSKEDSTEDETEDDPAPTVPEPIAQIDEEIENLKQQRKDARSEFDNDLADELTDKIYSKQLEREKVAAQAEQAAKSDEAYNAEFKSTVTALQDENPDLEDHDSPLYGRLAELRDLTEYRASQGDPKAVDLMNKPTFLRTLVDQAKRDLGMNGTSKVPSPPAREVKRNGTVSPATASKGSVSTEAAISMLGKMSEEDLMAIGEQMLG